MSEDICWAAYTKDTEKVNELLSKGVDIECRDRDKRTPLLNSVSGDDISYDLVALLVNSGADVNSQDSGGFTALHFCAQNKLPDIADLLIRNGADANLKDQWGNIPLFRALGNTDESRKLIESLMAANSNPYSKNNSGISVMDHVLRLKIHPNHEYFSEIHKEGS